MEETRDDLEADFERFATASLKVQLWLERWHQSIDDVPLWANVAAELSENATKAKSNGRKKTPSHRARVSFFFELAKEITVEAWHYADIIANWGPRIIRADPAGSNGIVDGYFLKFSGEYGPGPAATAHGGGAMFLQQFSLDFFTKFMDPHKASWEFSEWNDGLVRKFEAYMKEQRLPSALELAARMIRERAYLEEFSKPRSTAAIAEISPYASEVRSKTIKSIAAAGPTHTTYERPPDWQDWLKENKRPHSPTSWRAFKGANDGENHPHHGDRMVRFPVAKLLESGLQPRPNWLPMSEQV